MKEETQAVIFDLDGLLADTERLHYEAYRRTLARYGFKLDLDRYEDHWIRQGKGIVELIIEMGLEVDANKAREEKARLYRKLVASEAKPMPGVREILAIVSDEIKVALASSSYPDAVDAVLAALGMRKFFDVVVTRGDVKRVKPDPELFLRAAERLGVQPAECVVLEDAEKGVVAAKKAGMYCIAVPNEFTRHHDFSTADMVVASLKEVNITMIRNLVAGKLKACRPE